MKKNQKIAKLGLLSAASFLLMMIEVPLLPAYKFLCYDPSDIIPLMAGLYGGVSSCFFILVIRNLCHLLLKPPLLYPFFGEFMSLLASLSFILPSVLVYRTMHNRTGAFLGIMLSIVCLITVMCLANISISPLILNFLKDPVILNKYLVYGVIPFNLIKGLANGFLTYFSYKKFSSLFLVGLR